VEKISSLHRVLIPRPEGTVVTKSFRQIGRWMYCVFETKTTQILQRMNIDTHVLEPCHPAPRIIFGMKQLYWMDTYLILSATTDIGNSMLLYDVLTNKWQEELCPSMILGVTATKSCIFAYSPSKFYSFDSKQRKWTILTSPPLPLEKPELIYIGDDRLLLFGIHGVGRDLKTLEYSIANNRWVDKSSEFAIDLSVDTPNLHLLEPVMDYDTESLYLVGNTRVWKKNLRKDVISPWTISYAWYY